MPLSERLAQAKCGWLTANANSHDGRIRNDMAHANGPLAAVERTRRANVGLRGAATIGRGAKKGARRSTPAEPERPLSRPTEESHHGLLGSVPVVGWERRGAIGGGLARVCGHLSTNVPDGRRGAEWEVLCSAITVRSRPGELEAARFHNAPFRE